MGNRLNNFEKFLVFVVILYHLGIILFSILWLFTNSFFDYKLSLGVHNHLKINEDVTYGLFISGCLGGSFYCLRALYQRIGDTYTPIDLGGSDQSRGLNIRPWFFWYLYRPIQGGVLALVLLALINGKMLTISELDDEALKSYFSLIGLGFLSGFGSHELIHKIQELISVLFAKSKISNSNSSTKVKENNGE
ncbi:hypothetical protein LZF95_23450 [Algoriphagus sp. AGSA1]|uniref:hypothetical protein n=1 Tax=Algoriphagus sp. AGSA1 TaxID=2907213 RepID=UPI001F3ED2B6|nr:hypothetical protein [Algoriphagus sp. AGSA1]MCE7057658.1 hypothetical protein [Algoriphagus sp. AGSA1]